MNSKQHTGAKHVLLVDDEPGILEVVTYCLELLGLSVSTALTGNEALELIDANDKNYDLIISDIHMPFMNGWSLIQNISKRLHPEDLPPILVMTGYAELERECFEDQNLSSLISGCLSKPFSRHQLYNIVQTTLKLPSENLTEAG